MIDDDVREFLEHHGIKGQRWGVRNEENKQAKREAKAQKYDVKAKDLGERINKLKGSRNVISKIQVKRLEGKKQTAQESADLKREGKLTKRQKHIAVGAGAALTILAAYGTYSSLQSGNARRLVEKGKSFVTRRGDTPWKVNPKLADPNMDVDGIMNNVVKHVNPDFGKMGTKTNCRRATYAYEMRRRGYDVAATRTTNARGQDTSGFVNVLNPGINLIPPGRAGIATRLISEHGKAHQPFTDALENPYGKHFLLPKDIKSSLAKQPVGARGELSVKWRAGGGHSMAWENVKGKLMVFDNQTGKKYSLDDLDLFTPHIDEGGFTRLDNLPLNNDFLRRWVKSA